LLLQGYVASLAACCWLTHILDSDIRIICASQLVLVSFSYVWEPVAGCWFKQTSTIVSEVICTGHLPEEPSLSTYQPS